MAGISSNPNSPRQKMINLMYLVFIAMMAINLPPEVLDGFELVEKSLYASTENSSQRNEYTMESLSRAYQANEAKVSEWYKKGVLVKSSTDSLYNYIEDLKKRIVEESDGKNANVNDIVRKDNLEAASQIMLAPITGEGRKLKGELENYRKLMSEMIGDPYKAEIFASVLSTEVPKKGGIIPDTWENALFENMPVAAAVTLLTKMQSDIRFVEGETLSTLITNVDEKDYRVNKIQALVIPKSQVVTRGMPFEAQLVLAAVDSTKQPEYYLGSTLLSNNIISITNNAVGDHPFTGKIVADGEEYSYNGTFSVTEPSVTIAPVLMNFLYESIPNDVSINMSGVPSGAVTASLEGSGSIRLKEGNIWTITGLSMSASPKVSVVTKGSLGGRSIEQRQEFNVRPLPPPQPLIAYKDADGTSRNFTGGTIAKRALMEANGVQAAIDDGVLYVPHRVTSFTMMVIDAMGNFIPERSESGEFTPRQKEVIRNLQRGKQFFITNIKALDPAGKPVTIQSSMQVIINQ
ncbi:MAG: gliding motility protein GldM [Tannerella sp.]|jgi:gliding motility-associated protein GldM|nr:gliding motility protein GldM [Tannerella sp.]